MRVLRDYNVERPRMRNVNSVACRLQAVKAGPGNGAKCRRVAGKMGLDADVWFNNVELAISRAVSREPVIYVRNIYKYYVAYRRIAEHLTARHEQRVD